jgi:cytidine deaminase
MSRNADPLAELFAAAKAAQTAAYAPYSRFPVGAALRTPSGAIYSGGNVENAAYPEGVCAETSAISAMAAAGERRIAEICVVGGGEALCTPCGGCRQRIREFADAATIVHVAGPEGVRVTFHLSALLPESFGPGHLRN